MQSQDASRHTLCLALFSVGMMALVAGSVSRADDADPPSDTAAEGADSPKQPEGILPIPEYTGDFWTRSRLTGDWGGARTELADMGIQFDTSFTQSMQTITEGGRDTGTRYGGTLDYLLTFDLMRMGVMPGGMVKIRGESRYGESVNGTAGPPLPVNTDAFFPFGDSLDDNIPIAVTNLTYYQFFSEHFGVFVGKIDVLDGDPNEFASGRGVSQFMNANLVFPTSPLIAVPAYSTLGAGAVLLPVKGVTLSTLFLNASDSSTTTGFEDFGEGTAWMTEADFQYRLGDLPGGQNIGFVYGFDNTFLDINSRFTFRPGQGIVPPTTDETWAVFWSAWQYLYVENPSDDLIDVTNGKQDRQGVGLFARVGIADDDTNPLDVSVSGGVGAKGLIPGRDEDTMGVGYFYIKIQPERLVDRLNADDEVQGFEAYYNIAITPAANLTLDLQVVDSADKELDTAVILGWRLNLLF